MYLCDSATTSVTRGDDAVSVVRARGAEVNPHDIRVAALEEAAQLVEREIHRYGTMCQHVLKMAAQKIRGEIQLAEEEQVSA